MLISSYPCRPLAVGDVRSMDAGRPIMRNGLLGVRDRRFSSRARAFSLLGRGCLGNLHGAKNHQFVQLAPWDEPLQRQLVNAATSSSLLSRWCWMELVVSFSSQIQAVVDKLDLSTE